MSGCGYGALGGAGLFPAGAVGGGSGVGAYGARGGGVYGPDMSPVYRGAGPEAGDPVSGRRAAGRSEPGDCHGFAEKMRQQAGAAVTAAGEKLFGIR